VIRSGNDLEQSRHAREFVEYGLGLNRYRYSPRQMQKLFSLAQRQHLSQADARDQSEPFVVNSGQDADKDGDSIGPSGLERQQLTVVSGGKFCMEP
jgi:hypothetical protein